LVKPQNVFSGMLDRRISHGTRRPALVNALCCSRSTATISSLTEARVSPAPRPHTSRSIPPDFGYQNVLLYSAMAAGSGENPARISASSGGGKKRFTARGDSRSSEIAMVFSFCGMRNRSATACPKPLTM
jgi:hypothetical protein